MCLRAFLVFCVLLLLPTASGVAAVVINEVRHDNPGADTEEYVELFGAAGQSLSGLTFLVIGDDTSESKSGIIESVVDLSAFTIGASGYFVIAPPTVRGTAAGFSSFTPDLETASLVLENGDNVTYLLVSGFTGSLGQDLDPVDELSDPTFLTTFWTDTVDAVSLFDGDNLGDFASSEINYGPGMGFTTLGPDDIFPPAHIYRLGDGGPWTTGVLGPDFDTPGMANAVPEPSSVLLIATAGVVMLRRRASKQKH